MGYFLTDKSRIWQTDVKGRWKLIDNELYLNDDGIIQMCPRYFWSDGYTFPSLLLPITGDRHSLNVLPAHQHDLECRFHERIIVKLTVYDLVTKGFLKNVKRNNMWLTVCEDIPLEHLYIEKVTKRQADNRLEDMMLSVGIPSIKSKAIRFGVRFNINWLRTGKKSLSSYNIYNEDIGLVQGL